MAHLSKEFKQFKTIYHRFDEQSNGLKTNALQALLKGPLPHDKELKFLMDHLLFTLAYPESERMVKLCERLLKRIGSHTRNAPNTKFWQNSGLPFATIRTRFSHEQLCQLLNEKLVTVLPDGFEDPTFTLNEVLKQTLPSVEREITTAGLSNEELLEYLEVKPDQQLEFLTAQLKKFSDDPLTLDFLFDGLSQYVRVKPKHVGYSRAFNGMQLNQKHYQSNLVRRFDHEALLAQPLPAPLDLNDAKRDQWIKTIKRTLILTARETDPVTYMQSSSLRIYALEGGIYIALYGMIPKRQLSYESYIGFTLFRNGLPISYGGGWMFGERCLFGMNIFEPYRGGESGLIMCQLLRTYMQVSGARHIEVEPYQYGLDNPEGIASGAFWFYYRYGFRPVDPVLRKLAADEFKKIKSKSGYRSSEKTLIRFTESNIALSYLKEPPLSVADLSSAISTMIATKYKGDRAMAIANAWVNLFHHAGIDPSQFNVEARRTLEEMALWYAYMKPSKRPSKETMVQWIELKTSDWYTYQQTLLKFMRGDSSNAAKS